MSVRALLIALFTALYTVLPAHAARQALVIGNAAYTEGALRNPVNDARAMEAKLTALGFTVMKAENLKRQQIGRTLTAFANTLKPGDEVVVFYAGHGVQVKGINYLPAVDADIQSEDDVALNSLNLNTLMERLDEAKAGLKLFFLDACRNNPYARSLRSNDRGLARVSAAPSGTLIHFATRPGSVAADGAGSNGLYTSQLLRFIDSPDMPVEIMLKRVSAAVAVESKKQQEPWTEGSIVGDFYFRPGALANTVKPEPAVSDAQVELQAWTVAQSGNTVAGYAAYLKEYPKGRYSAAAKVASASLAVSPVTQPSAPFERWQEPPRHYKLVGNEIHAVKMGLIFKRCAVGQTWTGLTCSGAAGLYTEKEALSAEFRTQASPWRLPTSGELSPLMVYFADQQESVSEGRYWTSSPSTAGNYFILSLFFPVGGEPPGAMHESSTSGKKARILLVRNTTQPNAK